MAFFNRIPTVAILLGSVLAISAWSITINWDETRQEIDGFGCFGGYGSGDDLSDESITTLLDSNTGCGYSILRWEFPMWDKLSLVDPSNPANGGWPYGYGEPWAVMKKAIDKGCKKYLFSAWSCPGFMKSNGQLGGGGHLLPEYYDEYAKMAKDHFQYFIEEGFDTNTCTMYFSPTNEPNLVMSYASMQWTEEEMRDFTRDHLGPAIKPLGVKIVLGEEERWDDGVVNMTLDDEEARSYVDVVAGHGYWWNIDGTSSPGEPLPFTKAQSHNIHTWQTEICNTAPQCPTDMDNGLMWGENIHRFMTNAEANGYIWWWSTTKVTVDEEALQCFDGTWRKLTWVIGQYAKFVRPGFFRITTDAANDGVPVLLTAYKEKHTGNFAIVVLNQGGATSLDITFNGCSPTKVTPYTTTDAANIQKGSDISVSGGSFSASLPGLSATTFVGNGPAEVSVKPMLDQKGLKNVDEFSIHGRTLSLPEAYKGKSCAINMYSMNGSLVYSKKLSASQNSGKLILPANKSGVFMVQLMTETGMSAKTIVSR